MRLQRHVCRARGCPRSAVHCRRIGVSLIEALWVLAIVAVLGGWAYALGYGWWAEFSLTQTAQRLYSDLLWARSMAIQSGQKITVCPLPSSERCDGHSTWSEGWQVIMDHSRDHNNPGYRILRQAPAVPAHVGVVANSPVSRYIAISPDGVARMHHGAFQAGTLTVCRRDRAAMGVRLVLNAAGRWRWEEIPQFHCPSGR
ncbi:GspH/FimT family pseudopilin [Tepidimonas sp.]|uniref:GspH/FimT family pseudopilin n=1 Tax=Tepidimonas sp. TaxID=2002775 RepID=UPI00399F3D6B